MGPLLTTGVGGATVVQTRVYAGDGDTGSEKNSDFYHYMQAPQRTEQLAVFTSVK